MPKKRIAVFFGGRSPEHDVSIVTGLQVLSALREDLYETIPVYVSTEGDWLVGEPLRDRSSYIPSSQMRGKLLKCILGHGHETGILIPERKGFFSPSPIVFDVALPAFHGGPGEDGSFQGLMELAGIPYTGMRVLGSSISMDKAQTKVLVQARTQARQLPSISVFKGPAVQAPELPESWHYPVIVKPARMGSSIGVGRADSKDQVRALLQTIFLYDSKAILEPYVAHRQEFNIAVRRRNGRIEMSAIELPKSSAELLDFREKYVKDGGKKQGGTTSEGMLSLTREINPKLEAEIEHKIRLWASEIFDALEGTGCPRLDFMFNTETRELWFNEINPCPGSFAYFLWEAGADKTLFSELLTHLIEEAVQLKNMVGIPVDPVPKDAQLFRRG